MRQGSKSASLPHRVEGANPRPPRFSSIPTRGCRRRRRLSSRPWKGRRESRSCRPPCDPYAPRAAQRYCRLVAHGEAQQGMIEPIDRVHQPATEARQPLLGPCQKAKPPARGTHEHGRHHRHVGETEQDGSDEGKGERERHGLEHLAADTAEEEDGG